MIIIIDAEHMCSLGWAALRYNSSIYIAYITRLFTQHDIYKTIALEFWYIKLYRYTVSFNTAHLYMLGVFYYIWSSSELTDDLNKDWYIVCVQVKKNNYPTSYVRTKQLPITHTHAHTRTHTHTHTHTRTYTHPHTHYVKYLDMSLCCLYYNRYIHLHPLRRP